MRRVAAVAVLLRRLRAERATVALVFVLVAVTSAAVAAAPRLFDRVADDGLRYEMGRGTAIGRNLEFTTVDPVRAGTDDDPLGPLADRGLAIQAGLPPSVRSLVEEVRFVVDSPRFTVVDAPVLPTFVTLRGADDLGDQVDLVDGRWPAPVPPGDEPDGAPTFEIALADVAAERVGLTVGDRLDARVDISDILLRSIVPKPRTEIRIVLVGLYKVRDPGAPAWFDDRSLVEATIGGTGDQPLAFATGLVAPAAYADVLALELPTRNRWRLFVDVDRLDAAMLGTLVADLRGLETRYVTTTERRGVTVMHTGLLAGVERYLQQRTTTETVLSLAALGPLAVAAGAVGLIGVLIVRRRRAGLALARGRGASRGQLLAAQLWEGLLVTIPAALVGLGVAVAAVPGRPSDLSATGAILVALGATGILLVATWPVVRRGRRDLERDDPPVVRVTPRRLVFEALVIGLSLTAAWLLRARGLAAQDAGGTAPPGTTFDPFLTASPVLLGVAVALLVTRFYPIPVRALGWLTARRRDLVPVLGLRALGRHPSAGSLPLLILTVTLAIGTFSSVLLASLERSQAAVAFREVGADFRVTSGSGGAPGAGIDPRSLVGAEAVAAGLTVPDASLSTDPGSLANVFALAVEPARHDAVVEGVPGAPALAISLFGAPTGPDAGTTAAPIPALVSTRVQGLAVGDRFELGLRGQRITFRVAGRLDAFPGIARATPFVVMPLASVVAARNGTALGTPVWFVRGPATLVDGLRASSQGSPPPLVVSRYERYAALRDAPLVGAVSGGFALAIGLAGAYAVLAVTALVVLHAQRRAREVAFLRTLGLTGRQVAGLTVVEQGLPLVLALVLGVALGLGLAYLLAPGIDLAAFSAPDVTVGLEVDWVSIGAVSAAIAATVGTAIAISSWLARRLDIGRALRIGED